MPYQGPSQIVHTEVPRCIPSPSDWHFKMTMSALRPADRTSEAASPIEAWLTPIGIAALVSGFARSLGSAMRIMTYYQMRWHTHPNTPTGPLTLTSSFGARTFLYALGWSVLFGLCYREWRLLRRATDSIAGMIAVPIVYGTVVWLVMHVVVSRSKVHWNEYELLAWLQYVLFLGPPIVWAVRRFSPLAPSRPVLSRPQVSRESGRKQIISGLILATAALLYLRLLVTSPATGYTIITAAVFGLVAVLILGIAASLILGGIWTRFGLPGRSLVRLSPLLLAVTGAWYMYVR
jgi:hypothetical protein